MFDIASSSLCVVVGIGFSASLRQKRQKANTMRARQALEVHVHTYPMMTCHLFSRLFPTSKRVSSAPAFAFPCPRSVAVCSDYSFTEGMVVSTVSAVFGPAVPPHSGCFIQKT